MPHFRTIWDSGISRPVGKRLIFVKLENNFSMVQLCSKVKTHWSISNAKFIMSNIRRRSLTLASCIIASMLFTREASREVGKEMALEVSKEVVVEV